MKTFKKFIGISLIFMCFSLFSYSQNKPKATYQVGTSKVTVWENKEEGKFGKYSIKNFKVEKTYKKDDKWESTNNFTLTELLQLRAAIDKAISEEGVKIK
ncbi:MAG: hypothetical protein K8R54_18690 [Bacteroidales bacterium]|nr:hypothetical protein [Bacteroidales bacterium]